MFWGECKLKWDQVVLKACPYICNIELKEINEKPIFITKPGPQIMREGQQWNVRCTVDTDSGDQNALADVSELKPIIGRI